MMSTLRKMGMGHKGKSFTTDSISTEGESKMRNVRFSKGSFESSNHTIMNGSVDCVDDKENKGEQREAGNSSIDLVTPQCFFLSNKQSNNKESHLCTSVVSTSSSTSTSSPSFSCVSANNNSNNSRNSVSEEEVKPLRDNLDEYGSSQGQNNHHHHHHYEQHHSTRPPQQSKPLVLTHDQKKMKRRRRGNIRNSTIITINCRSILNGSCSKSSFSFSSLLFGLMFTIASLIHSSHEQSFFSPSNDEWDSGSFRSGTYGNGYTCVNIPVNFTLCKNIGYNKMMIPNLLGHDSLQEAEFHAKSWVPLLGLQCHPDTQLFLCSLFSPICLDRPIYPCRSLCQGVQAKCEPRMLAYNYPWPSMLKCDQFPEDHDLCIRPGAANASDGDSDLDCPSCNQAHTCENIVDNFCRADFVFRAKYKKSKGTLVEFRKERWFKPREGNRRGREFRTLSLDSKDDCCATKLRQGFPYIVMGVKRGDDYIVTFAMQWNPKDKILKNAVRTFRSMDCTNPLPMSVTAAGGKSGAERNGTSTGAGRRRRRKQGRRRDRQYGGCRVSAPGKNN